MAKSFSMCHLKAESEMVMDKMRLVLRGSHQKLDLECTEFEMLMEF